MIIARSGGFVDERLHKRPAAQGFCVAAALMCSAAASESMEPPVLVMYENVGMTGRSATYTAAVADIDVRYPFHSVSAKSGRNRPEIISAPALADAGASQAEAMLRGYGADFFKAPMFDGVAISADDTEAVRNFCREAGFNEVEFSGAVLSTERAYRRRVLAQVPGAVLSKDL